MNGPRRFGAAGRGPTSAGGNRCPTAAGRELLPAPGRRVLRTRTLRERLSPATGRRTRLAAAGRAVAGPDHSVDLRRRGHRDVGVPAEALEQVPRIRPDTFVGLGLQCSAEVRDHRHLVVGAQARRIERSGQPQQVLEWNRGWRRERVGKRAAGSRLLMDRRVQRDSGCRIARAVVHHLEIRHRRRTDALDFADLDGQHREPQPSGVIQFRDARLGRQRVVRQREYEDISRLDLPQDLLPPALPAAKLLVEPDGLSARPQNLDQRPHGGVVLAGVADEGAHLLGAAPFRAPRLHPLRAQHNGGWQTRAPASLLWSS